MYSIRNTYTKIGTIQRRLAWPLRKDDTQNREAFHIFLSSKSKVLHIKTFASTKRCALTERHSAAQKFAMAGNWTRVDCLEGNHANHYTTIANIMTRNTIDNEMC